MAPRPGFALVAEGDVFFHSPIWPKARFPVLRLNSEDGEILAVFAADAAKASACGTDSYSPFWKKIKSMKERIG